MKGMSSASVVGLLAWCAASGCGSGSAPVAPSAPSPVSLSVQGIVRAVNGESLDGAHVELWSNLRGSQLLAATTSGPGGAFRVDASTIGCPPLSIFASLAGYRPGWTPVMSCASAQTMDVKLLQALTFDVRSPSSATVQMLLSNDNPDYSNLYDCRSCQEITLSPSGLEGAQIVISWSTNDRLSAWVEAYDRGYQEYGLGQFQPAQGQSAITFAVPPEWNAYAGLTLLIGLPLSSGDQLQSPVQVVVSGQRPSQAP